MIDYFYMMIIVMKLMEIFMLMVDINVVVIIPGIKPNVNLIIVISDIILIKFKKNV